VRARRCRQLQKRQRRCSLPAQEFMARIALLSKASVLLSKASVLPSKASVLLSKASVPLRHFASTKQCSTPFRSDESLVIRSPYPDIPPVPNTSISRIILNKSKSFSGAQFLVPDSSHFA
jgi:hypothetical protein